MGEIWKDIEGFENYMVSNYGKLKRIYKNKENIIKGHINKKGIIKITLRNKDKRSDISLAKLVARTFIKDASENEVVIHIDGNKINNKVDNLKVITREECGKINGGKCIQSISRKELEKAFIEKFSLLHGDKWEYVGGYTNSRKPIIIKCKICGSEINIIPENSLRKTAKLKCNKCEAEKYANDFKFQFNNKYKDKYEYIDRKYNSNAFSKDTHIIKCLKCGKINEWKCSTLYNGKFKCYHDDINRNHNKRLTEEERKQRKIEQEINKTLSELSKEIKDIENRNKLFEDEVNRIKECKVCGNIFRSTKRSICCSDICTKKYRNRQHDLRRRIKNKEQIDNDISLEKLIQRDEGICKICGRQVDINDYYYVDEGYFIAGENYPSIDHIIPLAKGGTHTWDNIQLAHRHCNTIKNDKIIEQEDEQLKWI